MHHANGRFRNVYNCKGPNFIDFLRWRLSWLVKRSPREGVSEFSVARNDPEFLKSNRNETTLTWIGHATVLLQLNGKNILTDPHFSQRASPVQWAGPRRVVPPGVSLRDLPEIDMVVISHNHYDSLDTRSITRLYEREQGRNTTFFVPLGLGRWFRGLGISRVIELDWWDRHEARGLEIIAVPAQHWSKRLLESANTTLWAGWVIRSKSFRFFFAGDSGYNSHFKEIGRTFGPFDLCAIPIGAYEPRWFMRTHHMNPREAVQVHLDVRSRKSVGIHWGTFKLTDEPLDEPPKKLANARKEKNVPEDEFEVLKHGQTIVLSNSG